MARSTFFSHLVQVFAGAGRWLAPLSVVLVIIVLGSMQANYKISLAKPIKFIGHADEAGYVAMGESLADRGDLNVNYVSWFFIPYDKNITRREDHWPPFMGFAIAPFFMAYGQEPWVSKLAPIYIGSIGLPLAAAWLGYAFSRRGYVGIIAGLLMMTNNTMFTESLKTLSDVATAMWLAAFCAAVIAARERPWVHLVAGLCIAGAYYAKGSEIILLGLYPLLAVLCCGVAVLWRKWVYLGALVAVLLMAPWWYSNWKLYGKPLHSTQNFVSGYMGLGDWESNTYRAYWGNDLPKTSDRWKIDERTGKVNEYYWRRTAEFREAAVRHAFFGDKAPPEFWRQWGQYGLMIRDWLDGEYREAKGLEQAKVAPITEWHNPRQTLPAAGAVLLVLSMVATLPLVLGVEGMKLIKWWRRRRKAKREDLGVLATNPSPHPTTPWLHGKTLAIVIVLAVHWAFLAYLWEAQLRFCFIFFPLVAVLGVTFAARVIEMPVRTVMWAVRQAHWGAGLTARPRWLLHNWQAPVTVVVALALLSDALPLSVRAQQYHADLGLRGYPYDDNTRQVVLGAWIKKNLPQAIIMSRLPWQLRFYCAKTNKTVNQPYGDAKTIFSIAKYYGVTHIVDDNARYELEPYFNGQRPGLKRVAGAPDQLFEIDYSVVPWRDANELLSPKTKTDIR